VAVGDFNGESVLDLAVANAGSNSVSVLLGTGDGGFAAARNFAAGTRPYSVAVGDFNGDGALDLAMANYGSNNVSVLLGTGDGGFAAPRNFAAGGRPSSVAVADFNGDGALDLAVANFFSNNVSVLLGTGDGPLLRQPADRPGLVRADRLAPEEWQPLPRLRRRLCRHLRAPAWRLGATAATGPVAIAAKLNRRFIPQ
jgi:hypothetical protein